MPTVGASGPLKPNLRHALELQFESMAVEKGILLGMGNPLLDISAVVKKDLLDKYNLKANDAILYEKEDLYDDLLRDYEVEYIAGGATQNSMRVAQWILGVPEATSYFGCVGVDDTANKLEKCARDAGVDVRYVSMGKASVL